jgi:curved DNA-binding protein CbpA
VTPRATTDEIEHVYRIEAKKRHPDLGGDEERMKSLNEARGILANPETRREYDRLHVEYSLENEFSSQVDHGRVIRSNRSTGLPSFRKPMMALLAAAGVAFASGLALIDFAGHRRFWLIRILSAGLLAISVLFFHSAATLKNASNERNCSRAGMPYFSYEGILLAIAFGTVVLIMMIVYIA